MIAYHRYEAPATLSGAALDGRLAAGWFRMHQEIFTTTHLYAEEEFHRVHWLRYRLSDIHPRRSHDRIRRKNRGHITQLEAVTRIREDHEELYARYRASIRFDGADSIAHSLFGEAATDRNIYRTKCISVYDGPRLIAGGYFDVGETAGASILHFFDPAYQRFSLGKYMMLLTVDYLRANGYSLYYPGYIVSGREKMNYKLFLGWEAANYFDVTRQAWEPVRAEILLPESLNEIEKLQVALAFME